MSDADVPTLIQRLKTCSADERRDVAMELARTGTDEAVSELIRMVEGRRRHGLEWYDLQEQLIGVEAFVETKRQDVLLILKHFYNPSIENIRCAKGSAFGSDTIWDEWTERDYSYPYVGKALGEALYHHVKVTSSSWGSEHNCDVEKQREEFTQGKAHTIIRSAISKLENMPHEDVTGISAQASLKEFHNSYTNFIDAGFKIAHFFIRDWPRILTYPTIGNLSYKLQRKFKNRFSWYNDINASISSIFINPLMYSLISYGLIEPSASPLYSTADKILGAGFLGVLFGSLEGWMRWDLNRGIDIGVKFHGGSASCLGKLVSYPIEAVVDGYNRFTKD